MFEKEFGCNDVKILARSNSEKVINDLVNKYGNYYCDNSINTDYVINYIIGDITSEKHGYFDNEIGDDSFNFITGNNKELTVYLKEYNPYKEDYIKRIFTTTYVKMFQKKGYIILHGACAVKNNRGIAIVGESGAGKTTLLLKLLKNGYSYLSNDRIALKKQDNNVIVCGIPFSMGIVFEDAEKIIDNPKEKLKYYDKNNKVFIDTKDISKFLNANVTSSAILHSIIVCDYNSLSNEFSFEKINNPLQKLHSFLMLKSAIPEQKSYLHDIIGLDTNNFDFLNNIESWNLMRGNSYSDDVIEEIKNKVL